MVPNHIMQLITLTAMEPPISFDADAVRDEQAKILHAIQPYQPEDVLSEPCAGSTATERSMATSACRPIAPKQDVPPDSRTETFVAMKLLIDNWRWADVPFYLRTGKRLPAPQYADRDSVPPGAFRAVPRYPRRKSDAQSTGAAYSAGRRNLAALRRQDSRDHDATGRGEHEFQICRLFRKQPSTGYERLLHDCMIGDATLFQRADMVEAGWCVVNPVLDVWKALPPRNFPNYAAGTWGPKRGRRTAGARWPPLEEFREMILAGDIGGTARAPQLLRTR